MQSGTAFICFGGCTNSVKTGIITGHPMPWLCLVSSQTPKISICWWVGWDGIHCAWKRSQHTSGEAGTWRKWDFAFLERLHLLCVDPQSPNYLLLPCNGLWLQPPKDRGNSSVCSQLRICPGLYSGWKRACWKLSWLNVCDGRSVRMHSHECMLSAKGEESCPHGSGNFK